MSEIRLTNREFWVQYWKNYEYEKIPSRVVFNGYVPLLKNKQSFIEIGGFPGINAAYFYKNVCENITLLDYYIDKNMVSKLEEYNNIPAGTIQCIEADFFNFDTDKQYDIVFSIGFIEHFDDTKDVIERHVRLLSDEGNLLIVLPNFRGLNGLVQYLFDRKNFKVHNLNSMKIDVLKKITEELGLKKTTVTYTRKPMLWLEPKPTRGNKIAKKIIKFFSYAIKIFPIKCRLLSPYIIIFAEK